MTRHLRPLVLGLLFVTALCARAADLEYSTTDFTWHEASRNRDVPARIYAPTSGGPYPVIIFSHGLGGSDKAYSYLGEYWAAHGFISVHVQHLGSDIAVIWPPGSMKKAMHNPQNYLDRPKDISFAIDQVAALNAAPGPWHGKFDLNWIGVAGHSFGAYTTMAIAGANPSLSDGTVVKLADPRVKAVIAMSTPPLKGQDFANVHIPALHLTGTDDQIAIEPGDTPADRRIPFDQSHGPDTYLIIFNGANHMTFSGRTGLLESADQKQRDAELHPEICQVTTTFWLAYLKGKQNAGLWLAKGGLAKWIDGKGTAEIK
jgi:predicted dienelactone hydrolase